MQPILVHNADYDNPYKGMSAQEIIDLAKKGGAVKNPTQIIPDWKKMKKEIDDLYKDEFGRVSVNDIPLPPTPDVP